LLFKKHFEQLLKVELKLVSISILRLFESVHCDDVLAQTILDFLGQHKLLFVKLEEDLQVHKVAFVLNFLLLIWISI